jgi:hypothetical protein
MWRKPDTLKAENLTPAANHEYTRRDTKIVSTEGNKGNKDPAQFELRPFRFLHFLL